MQQVVLYAVDEPKPGAKWKAFWDRTEPNYRRWFLKDGDAERPSYLTCARALEQHMPELVPVWESVVEQAGGGDTAARLLSLYRPPAYLTACSQAVWSRGSPFLIRNYDYGPKAWDAVMLRSEWRRPVIAMTDVLWGALDGMNDAGLAVALAFGGRKAVGDGFGIPLIVRYVLETCETTKQAAAVLERVPSHMTYNVTVIDAQGRYITAHVAPDRRTVITHRRIATNHQNTVEWHEHANATGSVDRERFLVGRIHDEDERADRFVERFLEPPLFSTRFDHGWGTLYTAVYRTDKGVAEYRWPGTVLAQSLDRFREVTVSLRYGRPERVRKASA